MQKLGIPLTVENWLRFEFNGELPEGAPAEIDVPVELRAEIEAQTAKRPPRSSKVEQKA